MAHTMEFKGFKAAIMKAARLPGNHVHGLPPGSAIDTFPVDTFVEPLPNWIRGQGNYVVPVQPDWGLWFDWTDNDDLNTAILPTVKGMNPITTLKTKGFVLEKYEEKCPIHNLNFKEGRYCEKCNYKWPAQNYVASPNTLWWDGFCTSDGKVRQFFFTEDLAKSIPEKIIGKEDTIPAFGFAFYSPKKRREHLKHNITRGFTATNSGGVQGIYFSSGLKKKSFKSYNNHLIGHTLTGGIDDGIATAYNCSTTSVDSMEIPVSATLDSFVLNEELRGLQVNSSKSVKKSLKNAEVGVGAGAEIHQDLSLDPLKLKDWEEKPSSVMRLYFVFVEQFEAIKNKGMKDLNGYKEGALHNLPIG